MTLGTSTFNDEIDNVDLTSVLTYQRTGNGIVPFILTLDNSFAKDFFSLGVWIPKSSHPAVRIDYNYALSTGGNVRVRGDINTDVSKNIQSTLPLDDSAIISVDGEQNGYVHLSFRVNHSQNTNVANIINVSFFFYPIEPVVTEGFVTGAVTPYYIFDGTQYPLNKLINVFVSDEDITPEKYTQQFLQKRSYLEPSIPQLFINDFKITTNYTLQIFKESILITNDWQNFGFNMYVKEDATLGRNFKRHFEFIASTAGNYTLVVEIYNDSKIIVASKEVVINVVVAAAPVSDVNVILLGDSLTMGQTNNSGVVPDDNVQDALLSEEFIKMITGTDPATTTSPLGLGYTDVNLVGTLAAPNRHEGYGGTTWNFFLTLQSPFWDGTQIDIDNYLNDNTIYNNVAYKGLDYLYIGLGLNNLETMRDFVTKDGGKYVFNSDSYFSTGLGQWALNFLNVVKEQIVEGTGTYANPNLKVIIWTQPLAGNYGGFAYHPFRAIDGFTPILDNFLRSEIYNHYYALTEQLPFLEICNATSSFDLENGYHWVNKQENRRTLDTEKQHIEAIHPHGDGYKMIADSIKEDFINRINS
jgi:hypothetical protein